MQRQTGGKLADGERRPAKESVTRALRARTAILGVGNKLLESQVSGRHKGAPRATMQVQQDGVGVGPNPSFPGEWQSGSPAWASPSD